MGEDDICQAQQTATEPRQHANVAGAHAPSSHLANTVLLATVLFFAGTAGRFDKHQVRWASLFLALVLSLLRRPHLNAARCLN